MRGVVLWMILLCLLGTFSTSFGQHGKHGKQHEQHHGRKHEHHGQQEKQPVQQYKGQHGEMMKVMRQLLANLNVRDVINIIHGFTEVPADERASMIKEVEGHKVQRVGGYYDVVVNANSLEELQNGWDIVFSNTTVKEKYMSKFSTTVIGFTGIYDSGKTFLLNEYINGSLASGVQVETIGLSMKNVDNIIWLDSAGSKRAVSDEKLEDRLATDHFITKMVLHMSDVVIYVVNNLLVTDIHNINTVYKKLVGINPTKKLLIVHNFMNYWTADEVEKHIQDDVIEAFAAQKTAIQECDRYLSHNGQVLHIILAKKGSPAGDAYNPCGMSLLRRVIQGVLTEREVNIFQDMTHIIQSLIPRYFFLPGQQNHEIPLVIDSVGVSHTNGGAKTDFLSWNTLSTLLKKAVQSKEWSVSNLFSSIFSNDNAVIENPFAIEIVEASQEENGKLIKLKSPFDLVYMPFHGNTHPDVAYKPSHEIYTDDTRIVIIVDLPDVSFYEVGCSNQVTLIIRGVRDMNPALAQLTRAKSSFNRRYGTFSITIPLPENVACRDVKDKGVLKNGVYTIDFSHSVCVDGFCN